MVTWEPQRTKPVEFPGTWRPAREAIFHSPPNAERSSVACLHRYMASRVPTMSNIHISLFGKLRIRNDDQYTIKLDTLRAQELFCYLLIYRSILHDREKLATLIWGDEASRSRKNLRQTLWQIQSNLKEQILGEKMLVVDNNWIGVNSNVPFSLDVAVFEAAFTSVERISGKDLSRQQAEMLQKSVEFYQGDLLEGWYQEWCIYERDRFQNIHLMMLDKLLNYCEAHGEYEVGVFYGTRIFQNDPAREQTHRRLMRLHYLAGNRTAALQQYEICVNALADELGVCPAQSTINLYEQIRADQVDPPAIATTHSLRATEEPVVSPPQYILSQLESVQAALCLLQGQVLQLAHMLGQTPFPNA